MKVRFSFDQKKFIRLLLIFSIFLVGAGLIGDLIFYFTGRYLGLFLFRSDRKTGITVWFGSMLFLFAALMTRSVLEHQTEERVSWYTLGILFLLLSIMKITKFQELIIIFINRLAAFFGLEISSLLVYAFLIILVFIFLLGVFRTISKESRLFFFIAGVIFVGAFILDCISTVLFGEVYIVRNLKYSFLSGIEELMEMVGTLLLIYGLCKHQIYCELQNKINKNAENNIKGKYNG